MSIPLTNCHALNSYIMCESLYYPHDKIIYDPQKLKLSVRKLAHKPEPSKSASVCFPVLSIEFRYRQFTFITHAAVLAQALAHRSVAAAALATPIKLPRPLGAPQSSRTSRLHRFTAGLVGGP